MIKKDTQARLELQGLTGGSAIALTGGAPNSPTLVGVDGAPPVIVAEPSANLLESVQNVSAKVDAILAKADKLVSDNSLAITDTIKNIDTFSKALGDSSSGIGAALTGISELRADLLAEFRNSSQRGSAPRGTVAQGLRERIDVLDRVGDREAVIGNELVGFGQDRIHL